MSSNGYRQSHRFALGGRSVPTRTFHLLPKSTTSNHLNRAKPAESRRSPVFSLAALGRKFLSDHPPVSHIIVPRKRLTRRVTHAAQWN